MSKNMIHFRRKKPVRRFFRRLHFKWRQFWTPERKNDFGVFIASALFLGLLFYMFIMYE